MTFNNRAACEGKIIIALAKAWVAGKGGGHSPANPIAMKAMRELTSIVRDFIDADAEEGRPCPLLYAETLMRDSLYIDRKRDKRRTREERWPAGVDVVA